MKTEIINHLKDAFGLEDADVKDIYDSYVSAFEKELSQMPSLLESGNFAELKRSAHTVKGCALNCGDSKTAEIAIKFQELAQAQDAPACQEKINQLKTQFEELK